MSNIAPLPEAAVRRYQAGQVGDDSVGTYLAKGWSLGNCCKACRRLVEWTPRDLEGHFATAPTLRIANLVPRLACSAEDGCRSREVAIFPHLYDGAWRWAAPADAACATDGGE